MKPTFVKCNECGAMLEVIGNTDHLAGGLEVVEADVVDAAQEKHVPTYTQDGNIVRVQVGEVEHPMLDEHHIAWIELITKEGTQRKMLNPTGEPVAEFALVDGDEVVAVYEYCTIHGLWKVEA